VVARPQERKFLGFSFTGGKEPKRIAPKALLRCKQRVRELTRRTRGISLGQMIKQLATYLRGWKSYFGFSQTPSVLQKLEAWMRRRLRSVIWKQCRLCQEDAQAVMLYEKMKVGPSKSSCRRGLQTAVSCFSQKLRW
jgi:hypothetical protein